MSLHLLLLILLLSLTSLVVGIMWYRGYRFKSMNYSIAEHVFRNVDAYVLLIDRQFNILKTNYYIRNHQPEIKTATLQVGDLLHCVNSVASAGCGKHDSCAQCALRHQINESFQFKENFSHFETTLAIARSDGQTPETTECCVAVTGNHIVTPAGDTLLLTIHDITRLKSIQLELNVALTHAKEADRMKSLFLANTSHELRTPLNAIIGFSELLAENPTAEDKEKYIEIIRSNNELLLQQVNDIIDLSKIEAGTLEFSFAEVDLNAIMNELESIYRSRHKDDAFEIRFERRYNSCYVDADRNRLSQVISNFLSNAAKYTVEGAITFGYENRESEIYCYVTDTGIGIPKEKRALIFERFVKVGSHKQGAGIGLAICKSMVDSVGGRIGVISEPGKGSTFWFTFPVPPIRSMHTEAEAFEPEK